MFRKVLIANRGEMDVPLARACQVLCLEVVALYSDADRISPHVLMADRTFPIGPCYGFFSEKADFARQDRWVLAPIPGRVIEMEPI